MFVVFYSFSDDSNHIHLLLYSVNVKLRIGSVTAIDTHSFQSEELFKDVTLFAEIHYTVQLNVVAAPVKNTMLDDKLFCRNV